MSQRNRSHQLSSQASNLLQAPLTHLPDKRSTFTQIRVLWRRPRLLRVVPLDRAHVLDADTSTPPLLMERRLLTLNSR